jgi:hypothetical protein
LIHFYKRARRWVGPWVGWGWLDEDWRGQRQGRGRQWKREELPFSSSSST